jgi:hypothetical protein
MVESDLLEVPLLNFLSGPVFLLYPDILIIYIAEKRGLLYARSVLKHN